MNHCLVTGAAGLLGRNLARALVERGCRVRALVRQTPLRFEHAKLEPFFGDVTDLQKMVEACDGIDTVFHTAAVVPMLGGRSATREYREAAYAINVAGTANLLRASREQRVARFVYTSSVDVCFDGEPLIEMDRSTPYARNPKSVYAETKIEAERRVLAANGEGGLTTCALRPDGIYAPEENEIVETVARQAARGGFKVALGSPHTLQDNSYIDNLVHGEILAAEHLGPGGSAAGRAYFISDYAPQNTFEFARPLIEGVGLPFPERRIPRALLVPIASLWEHAHFRLGIAPPPLSPHALDKVTVSHYGSIRDAQRDLAYEPVKSYEQAIAECVPYCRRRVEELRRERARRAPDGRSS